MLDAQKGNNARCQKLPDLQQWCIQLCVSRYRLDWESIWYGWDIASHCSRSILCDDRWRERWHWAAGLWDGYLMWGKAFAAPSINHLLTFLRSALALNAPPLWPSGCIRSVAVLCMQAGICNIWRVSEMVVLRPERNKSLLDFQECMRETIYKYNLQQRRALSLCWFPTAVKAGSKQNHNVGVISCWLLFVADFWWLSSVEKRRDHHLFRTSRQTIMSSCGLLSIDSWRPSYGWLIQSCKLLIFPTLSVYDTQKLYSFIESAGADLHERSLSDQQGAAWHKIAQYIAFCVLPADWYSDSTSHKLSSDRWSAISSHCRDSVL